MSITPTLSLAGLTSRELQAGVIARLGRGAGLARQIYRHFFSTGELNPEQLARLPGAVESPKLLAEMLPHLDGRVPGVVEHLHEDGTRKFRQQLHDGRRSESVLIPMPQGASLCLSSQVGCRMGCTFCQTATMGLVRQMSADEIVAQVLAARFALNHSAGDSRSAHPVDRIVFMGMGEPLDNFEHVTQAIRVLCDGHGLGLQYQYITISTVGRVGGIRRLSELISSSRRREETGFHRVNLAVSLNAPDDERRNQIMPINRADPLAELRAALGEFPKRPGAAIRLQYVLLKEFNDRPGDAELVAAFVGGLKANVNVIPWNPIPGSPLRSPTADETLAFVARLRQLGLHATARVTKGQRIMAACGQLGDPAQTRTRRQPRLEILPG